MIDSVLADEFPRDENQTQSEQVNNDDIEFKEYVSNGLKYLKSKMKTLTIIVGNSNNHIGYTILLGKSEAVETGFRFMGIEGNKVLFKWKRYPNRYMYMNIRYLSFHFLDGSVISGTTDDPYKTDDTKVLTSGSLTDFFNEIKETVNDLKEMISDIKEIRQNIKDILQTTKDLKDRLDDDELDEQKEKNEEQDEILEEKQSH
jgi:hypothetical protein